jgi:hypothetical protein
MEYGQKVALFLASNQCDENTSSGVIDVLKSDVVVDDDVDVDDANVNVGLDDDDDDVGELPAIDDDSDEV